MWARLTVLATLCLVALAVAPISPASAAFVWGDAHQLDVGQTIDDMSCPTTTQCTVVGGSNDETTFNPETPGTANAVPIASSGAYGGISCWSATQCTAVGGGGEVTFNPQSPNSPIPAPHATIDTITGADLVSVSCPAADQCSAVDGTSGNEVTFNPTSATAQTPNPIDTDGDLTSVTCPGTTECVTVDAASYETTFNPTSGTVSITQEVGLRNAANGTYPSLSDVSCPNANQCTASANNGSVTTFNPNTDSPNATNRQFLSPTHYTGMACPTTSLCLTASANNGLVSFNPLTDGVPTVTQLGVLGHGPIVCVSATQCTTSNGVGATTFDPADPGSTSDTNFTPAVTGISCSDATSCSFGDLGGNFLSVTPQSNSVAAADVAGGSILAVSCPSAIQCTVAQANGYLRTFDPEDVGTSTLTYVTASAQVTAVDCPTVTVCAVGESNGFATTFDPLTQSSPDGTYPLDAGRAIQGISCADDTHCVAVDAAGAETFFDPELPRNLVPVTVDPATALVAVSCPADAQCTAVDGVGQEVTFNPLTSTAAAPVSIDAGNALGAIACPDATECIAVDSAGRSLAGNPQDAATPWDVEPIPGTSDLTGISCLTDDECSAIDSGGEYSLGEFVAVPASSAPPAVVTEPSTTNPATPRPATKRPPDVARVKAALDRVLAPAGGRARIRALLKAGGYTFTYDAPSAGKLALDWYQVPKRARLHAARAATRTRTPVLMASVSAKITKAGKVRVKVTLSRAGRTRLRLTKQRLTLTGQGSFTPSGARRTTVRRTFTVRR